MIVYRIEHKKHKVGPYVWGAKALWLSSKAWTRYFNPGICPDPGQDGLGTMRPLENSGFKGMKQMTNWFPFLDILRMRKDGFRVYKFNVERRAVRLGQKQVCFVRYRVKSQQEVALRILAWHRAKSLLGA